jgi:hypothetical protein
MGNIAADKYSVLILDIFFAQAISIKTLDSGNTD